MARQGPSSQSVRVHQLLTPLNHIMGFADLLLEEIDKSSKEEIRADVEKIRKAADQMLGVIQEDRIPIRGSASRVALSEDSKNREGNQAPGSVLVVDDDANNRILIARNLKKRGFEVREASDGLEALELIRKSTFDLVLCDIVMPGMDGIELLQHIHAEFGDQLPVMVISALDQMEMVEQCLDMEAVDFISKPFEPYILLAKVRANIRRKRRRESVAES
jgi:adenylate cyclase